MSVVLPSPEAISGQLRAHIRRILKKQGFKFKADGLLLVRARSKNRIRKLHSEFRNELLQNEQPFIAEWFPRLKCYFASGSEVDPQTVDPQAILLDCKTPELSALFRLASLWWSIPVSRGFGRRVRFVILDRSNNKLIGLLGLTDPVFNLRVRDSWMGCARP